MKRTIFRNTPISQFCSVLNPSKPTKRRWTNTTSFRKQEKFDVEAIAEVKDALSIDEGGQTTLLKYELTTLVTCRLSRLPSRNN